MEVDGKYSYVVKDCVASDGRHEHIKAAEDVVSAFESADRKVREAKRGYESAQEHIKTLKRVYGDAFVCSGVPYRIVEVDHPCCERAKILKLVVDSSVRVIG